ncbi:hypothetical protein PR048_008956 [Dryococelus australis]|uniref:Peptidase M1 membrane alanine aminopeptidase domain-containing protein n=1 Tax=Dryococelus australis TaxID=614101 RepID=A0ABQ9HYJ6_9NEOP|nr:hypothetical protein PR048_008956 [Dryococelus australis]
MEQCQTAWAEETGYPRENPPTNSIIHHDSHIRKSGSDPARNRTWFAQLGGEYSNHYNTMAPLVRVMVCCCRDTGDGVVWDHYEETPPMSTYLLAFAISEFEQHSTTAGNMSVWVRPGAGSQAEYALSVSQDLLTALEDFTASPYQLPKMDQLAVPDFSFGAMENWGLVTYRGDSCSTSECRRRLKSSKHIVAHISHQWFGNLVTMSWWTYPWLNEGFATYCEYFITAKVSTPPPPPSASSTPAVPLVGSSVTSTGMQGRTKWEIPENIRRTTASSDTIPTRSNPRVTPPGIKLSSPWREVSSLAIKPPRPLHQLLETVKVTYVIFTTTVDNFVA